MRVERAAEAALGGEREKERLRACAVDTKVGLASRDRPATSSSSGSSRNVSVCSLGLGCILLRRPPASLLRSASLHSPLAPRPSPPRSSRTSPPPRPAMAAVYRPAEAIALLRPTLLLPRIQPRAPLARNAFSASTTAQATHTSTGNPSPPRPRPPPPRKSISLTGDTGQVRWSDLSPGEKVVRTTQQSANLVVVAVGVLATAGVAYFLFADVFSPSSKTAHFNRATSLVRADARCQKLLGPGSEIAAYGEPSWSRWARNRHISSSEDTDKWGTEHLRFKFYVEGPRAQGVVHVHLTKRPSQADYEYETLAVDVKGHQRIDLVADRHKERVAPKFFGARWW